MNLQNLSEDSRVTKEHKDEIFCAEEPEKFYNDQISDILLNSSMRQGWSWNHVHPKNFILTYLWDFQIQLFLVITPNGNFTVLKNF